MSDAANYLRTVVRVFPDHAGTVLWFAAGPVSYDEAHLTEALVAEMVKWEATYYASLTDLFEWRPGTDPNVFDEQGLRLATRLAGELGDAVDVEYHHFLDGAPQPMRLRERETERTRLREQRSWGRLQRPNWKSNASRRFRRAARCV